MSFPNSKKSAALNPLHPNPNLNGLLLLDKPSGVTSFACVHAVKRKFGARRVGHCGTLDPAARGLLLILVGAATRQQDSFLALEKEYWFRALLGSKTSTGDLEGEILDRKPSDHVTETQLEKTLLSFIGDIQQIPPLYSALKYKGRPYYEYARKGVSIPRVPRSVSIYSLSHLALRPPYWEARVTCSRGTYIRTLVEDIAERLGTCATLADLTRERIGSYRQDQALTWEELRAMEAEDLLPCLQPLKAPEVLVYA